MLSWDPLEKNNIFFVKKAASKTEALKLAINNFILLPF